MTNPIIPESYTNKDWPRRVAQSFRGAFSDIAAAVERIATLEGATTYTVASITFTPTAEPSSPVEGLTYMDSTTHKLRTHDGTNWQDHW